MSRDSWWHRMCNFRLRISEEVLRANMAAPPAPVHMRRETEALAHELGWTVWLAVCIPKALARRTIWGKKKSWDEWDG